MRIKIALTLILSVGLLCSCKGVDTVEPTNVTVAEFDPAPMSPDEQHLLFPAVPTPSDLLIVTGPDNLPKVSLPLEVELDVLGKDDPVPVPAFNAAATVQFVESYLNTLSGFITILPVATSFKGAAIDETTLTDENVYVLDITGIAENAATRVEGVVITPGEYDAESGVTPLTIGPPPSGWTQAHVYAMIITTGVKNVDGAGIKSSYAFNLLKGTEALEEDGFSVSALPDKDAVQLEAFRKGLAPLFDFLASEAAGAEQIARVDIALAWTISIRPGAFVVNDPSVGLLPTPNDLVMTSAAGSQHDCDADGSADCLEGHLCLPIDCENDADASKDFVAYMNSLDGWPASMTLAANFSLPVDPASVTAESVHLFKIDATGASEKIGASLTLNEAGTGLTMVSAETLEAATSYAAVITRGIDTAGTSFKVSPSDVTAISKLTEAVVNDAGESQLAEVGITDDDAVLLEAIRLGVNAVITAVGLSDSRADIAGVWSFRVQSGNEAMFDPTAGIVPFPNDVLMALDAGGNPTNVNLPIDPSWPDAQKDVVEQMNKLDGFSPLTPVRTRILRPLNENSFVWLSDVPSQGLLGVLQKGLGDVSLAMADVTEVDLTAEDPMVALQPLLMADNMYTEGEVKAWFENDQLSIVAEPGQPLRAGRRYMVLAFDNLESVDKDADGNPYPIAVGPAYYLARSEFPLVNEEGKSNVPSTLSDADAAQLEQLRLNYEPIFSALDSPLGVERARVLMFWTFTTQRIGEWLVDIRKDLATMTLAETITGTAQAPADADLGDYSMPHAGTVVLNGTFSGYTALAETNLAADPPDFGSMVFNDKGDPVWTTNTLPFLLFIPDPEQVEAGNGYPIVILQHGLGGHKGHVKSQVDRFLAAGYAVVATDIVLHGDLVAEGGEDSAGFLSADAAATRDHIVQASLNLVQLAAMLSDKGPSGLMDGLDGKTEDLNLLDTDEIYFVGHSLGALVGIPAVAVSKDIDAAVFVATGGNLTRVLAETPDEDFKEPIVTALAAMGYEEGTPGYYQFLETAQTLLDRGDPVHYARHLSKMPLDGQDPKPIFMMRAKDDSLFPEGTTLELACAARNGGTAPLYKEYEPECHGFFFNPCGSDADLGDAAVKAAEDAIQFFDTLHSPDGVQVDDSTPGKDLPCEGL